LTTFKSQSMFCYAYLTGCTVTFRSGRKEQKGSITERSVELLP